MRCSVDAEMPEPTAIIHRMISQDRAAIRPTMRKTQHALKQVWIIEEQHPQLYAQRPCERDGFGIRHAAVAGFDFGNRVLRAIPPAPCAACRQIALPQARVAPCLGEVRADDIFRLASSRRHLPFSEGILDSQRPRCSSDNGRFQKKPATNSIQPCPPAIQPKLCAMRSPKCLVRLA